MSECELLYRCFVRGGPVPAALARAYEDACRTLDMKGDPLIHRLVQAGADLQSVEYALRRRSPGNGLTMRALVLLSLAEARPEFLGQFVLEQPARMGAWMEVLAAPFASAVLAVKGVILLWWYERGR